MNNEAVPGPLEPIAFLLGTWRRSGKGFYPTIGEFTYEEESTFTHTGRGFLVYSQRTWSPEDRRPMHSESGFLRAVGDERLELVVAHAFGITENAEGTVDAHRIELASTETASTSTAKRVDGVARRVEVTGDRLDYTIGMAFGGHPLQDHLIATLTRAAS